MCGFHSAGLKELMVAGDWWEWTELELWSEVC